MIIFKKVTVKNFLSYGNAPTSIELNSNRNTLIIGQNGCGKSSLVTDAITFVLYGKPYRAVKLGQLINSINLKGMVVELEFSIGGLEYRVIRGMKPSVFEIYRNGVLIEQEAATRDYQGYLEKHILKINYKTFCQVVILGTASFIPFMQLNPAQRRDVVEDVLDIAIFSNMNTILKSRMNDNKEETNSISTKIEFAKKETVAQQKLIRVLEEAVANRVAEERDEIAKLQKQLRLLNKNIGLKEQEKSSLVEPEIVSPAEYNAAVRTQSRLEDEKASLQKRVSAIDSLTECPTCIQGVSHTHKDEIGKHFASLIQDVICELETATTTVADFDKKKTIHRGYVAAVDVIIREIDSLGVQVDHVEADIVKREKIVTSILENNTDVDGEKAKLKTIAANACSYVARKTELLEERKIQELSLLLLKDSGIKAAIIKEYVPILNKLINKYLGMFGFFINFVLNENFDETIVSRGRDELSYFSLSEGEKRRVDLAILFAFRQISEMKNSASCNILVLDEVGSENFDLNARDMLMDLISELGGNNFIVSHSQSLDATRFDSVMKVTKKSEFSNIEFI